MKALLVIPFLLCLPLAAFAEDNRYNVRVYDGNREPIHHTGPDFGPSMEPNPCFPFGCGGISAAMKNPDPDARLPENLTACIYSVAGTLLYERESTVCPYVYVDQNQIRAERRRLEWLKTQAQ